MKTFKTSNKVVLQNLKNAETEYKRVEDCMQRNITDATANVVYNTCENKESRHHRTKNVYPKISDVHIVEGVMNVVMRLLKPRL